MISFSWSTTSILRRNQQLLHHYLSVDFHICFLNECCFIFFNFSSLLYIFLSVSHAPLTLYSSTIFSKMFQTHTLMDLEQTFPILLTWLTMSNLLRINCIDFQCKQAIIHDFWNILKPEYDSHLHALSIIVFFFKHW